MKNSSFRVGIIKEFSCKLHIQMENGIATVYFNIDYSFGFVFRLINTFYYNLSDSLVTGRKIHVVERGKMGKYI